MFEIIALVFSIVFIVDYSGAIDNLSRVIYYFFNKGKYNGWRIPLIGCSLCTTFWTMILYLSIIGFPPVYVIGVASLCAYSTSFILEIMYKVRELVIKLLRFI